MPNVETEQYCQAMNEWRSVLGQDPGNIEGRLGPARSGPTGPTILLVASIARHDGTGRA